ncbi:MAG: hypothetical protein WCJ64_26980 [Rhodospirillaceae bacterium]
MIDVSKEDIILERRTSGDRFALFCRTDLPAGYLLDWWSVMADLGGDAEAFLVRLDETTGDQGWTLLSLLNLAAARCLAEAKVNRSGLTKEAARHLEKAVDLERERRGDLAEAGELILDELDPSEAWPWLAAEFGEEGLISFTECLEGGEDYGHTLETILVVLDQLLKDAGRALPEQGQFGGMAIHVSRALEAIARRDRHLRSRR